MNRNSFIELTHRIYDKYHVNTMFDNSVPKDNGWLIGDEIHMSYQYSNNSIMYAVWCHEMGHFIIQSRFSKRYDVKSTFQCEFKAWDIAQQIHFEYFGKQFNRTQGAFCLNCLQTYSTTHYDFNHNAYEKNKKQSKSVSYDI